MQAQPTPQERVNTTTSLDELRDVLNAIDDELRQARAEHDADERLEDVVDLTDLPTFGGDAPDNTVDIWSWDADRLLIIGGYGFEFRDRD